MVTSQQFNGTLPSENAFEVNPKVAIPLNCKPPASKVTMRNIRTGDQSYGTIQTRCSGEMKDGILVCLNESVQNTVSIPDA